jgi:WD40 repeat protein
VRGGHHSLPRRVGAVALLRCARRPRRSVVVALRADRLGDVSAHAEFAAVVERGLYLLTSMDETGVREAIEGPARRAGLLLEPGLVDLLVRDVEGEPGALPMLSHALLQTWAHREGRSLTVAGYHASGGIRGAVAQSAELVYEQASPGQRTVVRDLMLRLVTPNPEGEPVRSRIPRRFVATDTDHEQVIELLVGARLVTSDEEMVELAHEALARAWPRLRAWLDDDADGQRILRHLSLAADTWDAMGRPDAELYRGVRLTRAMEWRERATPHLNAAEREFLDASQRHADYQREAARRRRRAVTTALVAGVVVTATLAAFALVNQRRADQEADRANEQAERASDEAERASDEARRADQEADRANEQAERANAEAARASDEAERADQEADRARAQALAASAVSTLTEDPSLAKLLAVASATVAEPTVETVATLHRAWAADRVIARPGPTYDLSVHAADIDPGGGRMVVAGAGAGEGSSKAIDVVDLATDTTAWKFEIDETSGWVVSPRFTTNGEQVAAGVIWDPYNRDRVPTLARGGTIEPPPPDLVGIRVWDADTGELVEQYDVGRCGGYPWAISNTHALVRTLHGSAEAVAACDWRYGTLGTELVDRRTGERRLLAQNSRFRGTALSDDGTTVAYDDVGGQHQVVVATTSTGQSTLRFTPALGQDSGVRALNDDGTLLLYGDQPIQVWDVAAGEQVASFDGHQGGSRYATFVPGTQTVLSTGADGTMREWDAETGREIRVYPGIAEGPVRATRDGLVLTIGQSGSNETPATLIDIGAHGELGAVETCPGSVAADSLRVTGALAVFTTTCVGDPTSTTYVIDWEAGRVLVALPGGRGGALAISPDGSRFVRQEGEGTRYGPLTVRDLSTGAEIIELDGLCTWDASSPVPPGQQEGCATSPEEPFAVRASRLKWSPDGTMIAAAARTTVVVWDADTGAAAAYRCSGPRPHQRRRPDLLSGLGGALRHIERHEISRRLHQLMAGPQHRRGQRQSQLDRVQCRRHPAPRRHPADGAHGRVAHLVRRRLRAGCAHQERRPRGVAAVGGAQPRWRTRRHRGLRWARACLGRCHARARARGPLGDRRSKGSPSSTTAAWPSPRRTETCSSSRSTRRTARDRPRLADERVHASECTRFGFGDECPVARRAPRPPDDADDTAGLNGSYEVRWTKRSSRRRWWRPASRRSPAGRQRTAIPGSYTVTFDDGRFDIVHDESVLTALAVTSSPATGYDCSANDDNVTIGCPPRPAPRRHVRAEHRRALCSTPQPRTRSTPCSSPAGASHALRAETKQSAKPDDASRWWGLAERDTAAPCGLNRHVGRAGHVGLLVVTRLGAAGELPRHGADSLYPGACES